MNISLEISKLLTLELLSEVRRLNGVRNGFSHQSAISEKQAKAITEEAFPVLLEILLDLRDLEKVELLRIGHIEPGTPPEAEIEVLLGHAQSRRVEMISMEGEAETRALAASRVAGRDRVLARIGSRTVDLCPFIYAEDDESGHRTRITVFKQRSAGKWYMEYMGDSVLVNDPEDPHINMLSNFEVLVNDGGS
jgi:hypothetical protein